MQFNEYYIKFYLEHLRARTFLGKWVPLNYFLFQPLKFRAFPHHCFRINRPEITNVQQAQIRNIKT